MILGRLALRAPTARDIRSGLLKHNYFPAISKQGAELPPSINSVKFTPIAAKKLITDCSGGRMKFDAVDYESTRYNLVARRLSVPHPLAYAHLVEEIAANWKYLNFVAKNRRSQFRPAPHGDGRVIAMNYGRQWKENRHSMRWNKFGAEYKVTADIANFYPGFYTHSIPWALVGHSHAKKNTNNSLWFNKIDMRFRNCNRGETVGLHVGPGTSAIGSDVILTAVDQKLGAKYDFVRFIDDYVFYAKNRREAEDFILDLSEAIALYGLKLNGSKTQIVDMPTPDKPHWMRALIPQIPQPTHFAQLELYLDEAMELAKRTPDGSVLKFAVNAVFANKEIDSRADEILPHLFTIAFYNPGLLPAINRIFVETTAKPENYADNLNELLERHARFRRSDGMAWTLHIMRENKININGSAINAVMQTGDCVALLLLCKHGQPDAMQAAESFAIKHLENSPEDYDIDKYWLFYYELFAAKIISNPYVEKAKNKTFESLLQSKVSFVS